MNLDNTHITLPCPQCSQTVETTLDDLIVSPLVTCGACGQEFTADVKSLVDNEQQEP